MKMRTILRPNFGAGAHGAKPMPHLSDYILVPALSLTGTWTMRDLIPPDQLARLARFTNELEAAR